MHHLVLDTNVCITCYQPAVLLVGVGWLHEPRTATAVGCSEAVPGWQRCCVCPQVLHPARFGRFIGLIPLHHDRRRQVCVGSHLRGLPPLPVSAAFDETWFDAEG